ncbi:uncharacterized protein BKA78DRAFT_301009 [Phyllosticta capitalensis]|uniref:uncharacterized protein n=1 Tax=Phyllosticta capitalensis TaxID=121624 RepID=UPI0031309730
MGCTYVIRPQLATYRRRLSAASRRVGGSLSIPHTTSNAASQRRDIQPMAPTPALSSAHQFNRWELDTKNRQQPREFHGRDRLPGGAPRRQYTYIHSKQKERRKILVVCNCLFSPIISEGLEILGYARPRALQSGLSARSLARPSRSWAPPIGTISRCISADFGALCCLCAAATPVGNKSGECPQSENDRFAVEARCW